MFVQGVQNSSTQTAIEYVSGLLQCEKGHENMERTVEKVSDSDYKRYVHFLSSSPWDHRAVNLATMKAADEFLRQQKARSGKPIAVRLREFN